jgi:phosphoglycolate phosphatase-like HAD superfamily hydrolase
LKVNKTDPIVIGDYPKDIQDARNTGISSIGVTWGIAD